jgi:hypothetical protein
VVAAAVIAASACGSDGADGLDRTTSMKCGPGTIAVAGECVPEDSGAGGAGSSGAGGEAGLAPDATGGEGAADAGVSDSTVPEVAPPGDAAEAESEAGWQDDPCPAEPIWLNCSDSCGSKSSSCANATCHTPIDFNLWTITNPDSFPFIIRTPGQPGKIPACVTACDKVGPTVASISIGVALPKEKNDAGVDWWFHSIKVKVGPPWRIQDGYTSENICVDKNAYASCRIFPFDFIENIVTITTEDPNAPARNVLIERPLRPAVCP